MKNTNDNHGDKTMTNLTAKENENRINLILETLNDHYALPADFGHTEEELAGVIRRINQIVTFRADDPSTHFPKK